MFRTVSKHLRRGVQGSARAAVASRVATASPFTNVAKSPQFENLTSFHNLAPLNRGFQTSAIAYGEMKKFNCPNFPESISDGDMKYLKQVGEAVAVDEPVCELETQKTSLPVMSDVDGVLKEYLVEDGDEVTPGTPIFVIEVGAAGSAAPAPAAPAASKPADTPKEAPKAPEPAAAPTKPVSTEFPPKQPMAATPAPKAAPAAAPVDIKSDGPSRTEKRVKMTRMRQTIAGRLKESQNTYAMLTTFNEVDMTAVFEMRKQYKDAFLKKHGVKLGFMSPFIIGAAAALKEMPSVNAVIDGKDIVYRDYVDISVAVATPRGLVVPVIRNADRMNLYNAEKTLSDLGDRGRKDTITLEDMDGGTFTISNGGVFGSMFGTPIINPPQSAILGMHNVVERPVVIRDTPTSAPRIEPRPIMYLALTYDHRLIDGREAVTFLRKIKSTVEDPRQLLLQL